MTGAALYFNNCALEASFFLVLSCKSMLVCYIEHQGVFVLGDDKASTTYNILLFQSAQCTGQERLPLVVVVA